MSGSPDSRYWEPAEWTQDFVDIEGDAQPAPTYRTRAKMLWDDDYLYIAAWMEEPHVWATLTEHDSVIFQDNDFEVFIDPDGDNHNYYEIEINALNTSWDLRLVKPYRDGGPALNEWEIPGFLSKVAIDGTLNDASDQDQGWSVEMAIPWQALGEYASCASPPRDGDQWRINFSRVEWDIEIVDGQYRKLPNRPEHNWVWSPQGVIDMHQPERWGILQFSSAPPGTAQLIPDPAASARELLMQVYHLQRRFHASNKRYAANLTELDPMLPQSISLVLTTDGYAASCEVIIPEKGLVRCHVRQDSLLWASTEAG